MSVIDPKIVINNAVSRLYEDAKDIYSKQEITLLTIVNILTASMIIVENYEDISGLQKKQVVIDFLNKIVEDHVEGEEDRVALIMFINMSIPVVIDSLISVDKQELQIKAKETVRKFCCF